MCSRPYPAVSVEIRARDMGYGKCRGLDLDVWDGLLKQCGTQTTPGTTLRRISAGEISGENVNWRMSAAGRDHVFRAVVPEASVRGLIMNQPGEFERMEPGCYNR
jgi:hypothetical protein